MSKVVLILNPFGTDVTPWVNGSLGSWKLLKGTVAAPGDTVITIPYTNKSGIDNVNNGVPMLDAQIRWYLANTALDILVFAYSQGCQVADLWITLNAESGLGVGRLKFLSIGNANRVHGGFVYGHPEFDQAGFTRGLPATVPWPYTDFCRQYDTIADFPSDKELVAALTKTQAAANSGTTENIVASLTAMARVMAKSNKWVAAQNALYGALLIHNWYFDVAPGTAGNTSYTAPSGVKYEMAPTFPVPYLGTGVTNLAKDTEVRAVIEGCFDRSKIAAPAVRAKNFGFGYWGPA